MHAADQWRRQLFMSGEAKGEGQDVCKMGHTFFISYFNPPLLFSSLSSLHPGYHPIRSLLHP